LKILIFGGLGYLGARVAQYLLDAQYEVVIATRELKSIPSELSRAAICQVAGDKYESIVSLCKGVDVVIHAAGLNAQDSANSPTSAIKVNGELTDTPNF
jgi:UDP-glucose 4-epimerase